MKKNIQEHLRILPLLVKSLIIICFFLIGSYAHAQAPVLDTTKITPPSSEGTQPLTNTLNKVFKGNISQSQYLPSEFYGTWQVTQTMLATNAPYSFKQRAIDIWILEYVGDKVRLSNPDTGAQAYVTVNQIVNNSATFTRESSRDNRIDIEQPTISVNDKYFHGQNYYQIRHFANNAVVRVDEAIFRIEAVKIAGPTVRFGR